MYKYEVDLKSIDLKGTQFGKKIYIIKVYVSMFWYTIDLESIRFRKESYTYGLYISTIFESDLKRYYMIYIFEVKIWKVPSALYPLCGHTVDSFYRYYSLSLIWVFRIWYSSVHRIPWRSPWSYDGDYIAQLPGWAVLRV